MDLRNAVRNVRDWLKEAISQQFFLFSRLFCNRTLGNRRDTTKLYGIGGHEAQMET